MDAIAMIEERRSVRNFKNEKVDRDTMQEIISIGRWAPSWANFQVARYTLIDDQATIQRLATDGVRGFVYNVRPPEVWDFALTPIHRRAAGSCPGTPSRWR
jgi:nitroreductase